MTAPVTAVSSARGVRLSYCVRVQNDNDRGRDQGQGTAQGISDRRQRPQAAATVPPRRSGTDALDAVRPCVYMSLAVSACEH